MTAWDVVTEFEYRLAEYTGAPYAVAVDSCTNALFLCFVSIRDEVGPVVMRIPKRTYVGVAQAVLNAGHTIEFTDEEWVGHYAITPGNVIDSARRFHRDMHTPGMDVCLSFHAQKHLPIGRGGAILTDSKGRALQYSRMRYDGRTPNVKPAWDTFTRGYHCMMDPKDAVQGMMLLSYAKDYYDDLPWDGYGDLSKQEVFNEKRI